MARVEQAKKDLSDRVMHGILEAEWRARRAPVYRVVFKSPKGIGLRGRDLYFKGTKRSVEAYARELADYHRGEGGAVGPTRFTARRVHGEEYMRLKRGHSVHDLDWLKRDKRTVKKNPMRGRRNPYVRYFAEKGGPVKKTSGWKTLDGTPASNTFWSSGDLDFGGRFPKVFVGPEEIDAAAWKRAPGSKVTTYLLHPDKWSGSVPSALGMIPNVSQGPGKPVAYARRVRYEVPVKLHSDPSRPKNPRAWFEARGRAYAGNVIGHTIITATQKRQPIYDEIAVRSPAVKTGSVALINGRRRRHSRRQLALDLREYAKRR